jgi:uncharacterized damage-inducible protein DinB
MTPEQASAVFQFLLPQIEAESQTTRRVLAAVPEERADYKPDPKSMSARELVQHITFSEIWFLEGILKGEFTQPDDSAMAQRSVAEILAAYDAKVPWLMANLKTLSSEQLAKPTPFFNMTLPLVAYLEILEKHSIHHRGQLSSYLRPLGAKVPSIYGGSADEPFTAETSA